MENTTYNTEETLKFINLMFNKQIEDKTLCLKNGKTNKYDIIQKDYVYKSFSVIYDFDLLNKTNFKNEITTYKKNGHDADINIILKNAQLNIDLFNNSLEQKINNEKIEKRVCRHDLTNGITYHDTDDAFDFFQSKINKCKHHGNFKNLEFYQFCYYIVAWTNANVLKTSNENKDEGIEIDLSDTKATEKIIYLKELGILDILRNKQPFNISTNSLASVLSAITGENNTTIQSYINPIMNDKTEQKNNPYNKTKTVNKVKAQLIHIGFQLK